MSDDEKLYFKCKFCNKTFAEVGRYDEIGRFHGEAEDEGLLTLRKHMKICDKRR